MPDQDRFESRLAAAYQRWAAEVPTEVDVLELLRTTRPSVRARSGRRWLGVRRRAKVLAMLMLITLAVIATSLLVGGAPQQRLPREYTNVFTPTGSMSTARLGHSATLLDDGRVLIAGGLDRQGGDVLVSAEVYDPATGAFAPTADLATPRLRPHALRLLDGRVLLVGGSVDGSWAETYDPQAGIFTPSQAQPDVLPGSATLLPDGRVLLAGGAFESGPASAWIYDPVTDSIAPGPTMEPARIEGMAVPLADGRVLLVGVSSGESDGYFYYEPEGERFVRSGTALPFAPNPGDWMTVLKNGNVLMWDAGGRGGGILLFDPATDQLVPIEGRGIGGPWIRPAVLDDGRVLFAGGSGSDDLSLPTERGESASTSLLYDPTTREAQAGPDMRVSRSAPATTLLADGRVLITGGADADDPMAATAELFE
jgi:hypothetical protein